MIDTLYTLVLTLGGLLVLWSAYPLVKNTLKAVFKRDRDNILDFPRDENEHA